MTSNTVINYTTALEISAILGKCTIKSLGSELLFPVIKLKTNLSLVSKRFHEIRAAIYQESGLVFNADGTLSGTTDIEVVNQVSQALKRLTEDETEVSLSALQLFNEKQLEDLFAENSTLTTNELEVLMLMLA
ncbi:hypothetical protein [Pedobacter gandavensis]|uniref:hypothetical protein n=1 Tax=Pedobacter gandavensis TaxID=2679963 RepID=UPI00292F6F81|nr:hypothetical protein [Pedobacter gandavensis]